jgi:pentatricopeptide repeat protein
MERGVDPDRDVYVQRYESDDLDASLLMLPDIGIEPSDSPRVHATIDAISSDLGVGEGLLFRYRRDEIGGNEGVFLACSFWLVRALSRLGRIEEATDLFESLCARSNDVALFGEELYPGSASHLGNFPQALTHSTLVDAALSLRLR